MSAFQGWKFLEGGYQPQPASVEEHRPGMQCNYNQTTWKTHARVFNTISLSQSYVFTYIDTHIYTGGLGSILTTIEELFGEKGEKERDPVRTNMNTQTI